MDVQIRHNLEDMQGLKQDVTPRAADVATTQVKPRTVQPLHQQQPSRVDPEAFGDFEC